MTHPHPILCLSGPTAAGKSASTLAIASHWPVEIITVDSATIYRGMDIGTAKPSREEQAQVPQHLLDIRDPSESYSAAEFCNDATTLIEQIRGRGRIPLLCGGTMMYYKALREGLNDLPGADPALRAELEAEAEKSGWPALHARLAEVDPVTAARLAPNDSQRIQRALEIWHLSGQPMSVLLQHGRPGAPQSDHQYVTISLEPSDRLALHQRIARRYQQMLEHGLVEEVRHLYERGDLHPGLPSVRCVGYRQLWDYLDGKIDKTQAIEQAIAATRQLAKRQLTWLRAQPDRIVVDCLAPDAAARVLDTVSQLWSGN
ncbi:tRNA (adenosine(37)-N6)-dimethylallyltransferase MiaA [Neopusillimonas aromaticivorans]|uniref:tRNA (adenosine(37)-N6)-dimethylallyltransferase MiaA n=1 Tax=Neopusillimonas aromaticivorans TaxID=2979868 RepID=UPI002593F576|nr:tRNA (adenosine(37)-N6)-dimethylallyltransferase MiaA [Neopusillimonas aromaticivorans]WJJ94125.1 tRNA (adenosine(37)-N6)-dimethylallyltransferase MiaA [Neopusillimonas aromaticivorans]